MIEDSDIRAAFALVGTTRDGSMSELNYELRDFRWDSGVVDVKVAQASGLSARLRVNLPSSNGIQPWLYRSPRDAVDWLRQLFIWIDEEVFTDGLGTSRARETSSGESYVVAESYGWRHADEQSHRRLSLLAGPFGWHGDLRPE